jgi:cardiolipin synthase
VLTSLVVWVFGAVFVVLGLIGLLFITRGTAVQHVRAAGVDGVPVSPEDPAFPLAISLLTGTPLLPGNHVELALNGDGTYERLWADLRGAQKYITLQMYYAGPGRVAETLATILEERVRAGVKVFFLYDAFGASDLPRSYFDDLRRAGIEAVPFRPLRLRTLWVVQNRSHARGIIIDGRIGWTGGFGFDDKWLGDGRTNLAWRETNARFEGPAVHQLQGAFAAAWSEGTGTLFSGRFTLHENHGGLVAVGLLYTAPTLGSTAAERLLALTIAGAQRSLYVTNAYFSPDRNFVRLLADAGRRGVDVRVLTGGPKTDVRTARAAARARYTSLIEAGLRIYEYQPSTLHAKTFVADGCWVSVGSMNFDNRSLALNDEASIMALDPVAGKTMETLFFDDLRHAVEIDLRGFRRRPWTEPVSEWGANLLTRVL